jgi:hypothetical protein
MSESTVIRHSKTIGLLLIASILVLTPALSYYAYATITLSGSTSGSVVAASDTITSASWTSNTGATCIIASDHLSFTCTGWQVTGGTKDNLTIGVSTVSGGSFSPQPPVITGDTGSFITYSTPGSFSLGAGGSTTLVYDFVVSGSATAESGVSVSVSILGP